MQRETIANLLAIQASQLDYYCQQLSAPIGRELRRRITARTPKFIRTDAVVEVAFCGIPRGGDIEHEIGKIREALAMIDPIALMDMTPEEIERMLMDEPHKKPEPHRQALATLIPFMSKAQWSVLSEQSGNGKEERAFFRETAIKLARIIDTMPRTGGASEEHPVAHLHYFKGGADWYIMELDAGAEGDTPDQFMSQCYGWARLFGSESDGELGYISLAEIVRHNAELDFHFEPKVFQEVLNEMR